MSDTSRRVLVHTHGPALWPEHKPLSEVLSLKQSSLPRVWSGTYQGVPTPPSGITFIQDWWQGKNRYPYDSSVFKNLVAHRYISVDAGFKDKETNAYTAFVVGELMTNYRLLIRYVWKERLRFDQLISKIRSFSMQWNYDEKLRGIIIEDKASGISAIQTLRHHYPDELGELVIAFEPPGSKEERAELASAWCATDCVWLPHPHDDAMWLADFEDELFSFPGSAFMDQVDAFSQLVLYTENFLAAGREARKGG